MSRTDSLRHVEPLLPTTQVRMVLADWVCIPLVTERCFIDALYERYPQHNLYMDSYPLGSAPDNARHLMPTCNTGQGGDPTPSIPVQAGVASKDSFSLAALRDTRVAQAVKLRERLKNGLAKHRGSLTASLSCASPADRLDRSLVAILGIPTSHNGGTRREGAAYYSLLTTHYPLLITHYSLLTTSLVTTHYSLLTTHYSLLTASLLTAHLPPLTAHCSLLTTHHSQRAANRGWRSRHGAIPRRSSAVLSCLGTIAGGRDSTSSLMKPTRTRT